MFYFKLGGGGGGGGGEFPFIIIDKVSLFINKVSLMTKSNFKLQQNYK